MAMITKKLGDWVAIIMARTTDFSERLASHASQPRSGGSDPIAQYAAVTLEASGWVDGLYTLSSAIIPADDCDGGPNIAQGATSEQHIAWGLAMPIVISQAEGTLTIRADGTVPTIDIPVMLEVR